MYEGTSKFVQTMSSVEEAVKYVKDEFDADHKENPKSFIPLEEWEHDVRYKSDVNYKHRNIFFKIPKRIRRLKQTYISAFWTGYDTLFYYIRKEEDGQENLPDIE